MAVYTTQQLNQIYTYIGFNHYITFEPEITQAITATLSVADGGSIADSSLQTQVLAIVAQLQAIDTNLVNMSNLFFIESSSSGSKINAARADYMLRRQGRALIKQLAIIFGIKGIRQDYYSKSNKISNEGNGISTFYGPDGDM